jgi:hypothetical protein
MQTFVLPRGVYVGLTRIMFLTLRRLFNLRSRWAHTYRERDRIMALFAPVTLLLLSIIWLALVLAGYAGVFWAQGYRPLERPFFVSGSSLLNLGFASVETLPQIMLSFFEAMIGLGLVALLIAYLPTMYTDFPRREGTVAPLEVYAGSPPSAIGLIRRVYRILGLEYLSEVWPTWEIWFEEEFKQVYHLLADENVPLKVDRKQARKDFAGWRVNDASTLVSPAALTWHRKPPGHLIDPGRQWIPHWTYKKPSPQLGTPLTLTALSRTTY